MERVFFVRDFPLVHVVDPVNTLGDRSESYTNTFVK